MNYNKGQKEGSFVSFFNNIQKNLAHRFSPKTYRTIMICLIISVPVILLLSHLGYTSVATWIVIFAGMFLCDILLMNFTKYGLNFVIASILALAIAIIVMFLFIFYIMAASNQ